MEADSAEPLLSVEDLSTHFQTPRGLVRAVDGVSFELQRGRTLGVVGESGSGKSVMARTLLGLLPSVARVSDETQIWFDRQDLRQLSGADFRKLLGPEIAMVFQDPLTSLNPVMTVGAQIGESLVHHLGMRKSEARNRAIELLASVGIPLPEQRVGVYPHQLSGGMRQRVAIAMALACEPKLLIADEPTTALDVTVQAEILDLLQRQQQERHMAMILITHDLGVVAGRTDDVAVMYAGKIVERAPTKELFNNMRMPYTEALMNSIPRLDDPPHTVIQAVGGRPPDLIDPPRGCRFSPRCRYAVDRCRTDPPELSATPDRADHVFSCWYPIDRSEAAA